jgi:hypothetical protein
MYGIANGDLECLSITEAQYDEFVQSAKRAYQSLTFFDHFKKLLAKGFVNGYIYIYIYIYIYGSCVGSLLFWVGGWAGIVCCRFETGVDEAPFFLLRLYVALPVAFVKRAERIQSRLTEIEMGTLPGLKQSCVSVFRVPCSVSSHPLVFSRFFPFFFFKRTWAPCGLSLHCMHPCILKRPFRSSRSRLIYPSRPL